MNSQVLESFSSNRDPPLLLLDSADHHGHRPFCDTSAVHLYEAFSSLTVNVFIFGTFQEAFSFFFLKTLRSLLKFILTKDARGRKFTTV